LKAEDDSMTEVAAQTNGQTSGAGLVPLPGRRIIVVGGAQGAGEAAVDAYLAAGARVVSLDISQGERDDGRPADRFRAARCDVAVQQQVDDRFAEAAEFLGGGLDAICVPAGVTERLEPEDITEERMLRILQINVMGTMFTNQAAFRYMKETGGSIINFSSIAGIRGRPMRAHYAATKGAVAAWTRAIAGDWAKYNIRANAVAPMIYTSIVDKVRNQLSPEKQIAFDKSIGENQLLPGGLRTPDSIGGLLTLLASEGSSYITGQIFSVDGGAMMLGS
jgi:NAD(P)-dependent dehydrogenase (short-subunit alcohol dehydrogenase family)